MPSIILTKDSQIDPDKYRIKLRDSSMVLGVDPKYLRKLDDSLPTIHTSSNVAIIGAGLGGMASAIKTMDSLKESDVTF